MKCRQDVEIKIHFKACKTTYGHLSCLTGLKNGLTFISISTSRLLKLIATRRAIALKCRQDVEIKIHFKACKTTYGHLSCLTGLKNGLTFISISTSRLLKLIATRRAIALKCRQDVEIKIHFKACKTTYGHLSCLTGLKNGLTFISISTSRLLKLIATRRAIALKCRQDVEIKIHFKACKTTYGHLSCLTGLKNGLTFISISTSRLLKLIATRRAIALKCRQDVEIKIHFKACKTTYGHLSCLTGLKNGLTFIISRPRDSLNLSRRVVLLL